MFILNTFKYESAHECESTVFPTYDRAYHEMVRQLEECAASEGIDLAEKVEGEDLEDEYGCEVGSLDEMGASLWDVCCWVINEVPGAFIPKKACDGFMESIRAAADMYGDEERFDWFDADDICKDVCWELEGYIG